MAARVIEELKAYGCDTDTAMERFVNTEELYIKFLEKFLEDKSFGEIAPRIAERLDEDAFQSVHTLKGVSGNLGLTPVFNICCYMVDTYREGDIDSAWARYDELAKAYKDVMDIIRQ